MNNTVKITIAALSGIALGYVIGRYLPPLLEEINEELKDQEQQIKRSVQKAAPRSVPVQQPESVEEVVQKTKVELPEVPEGFPLQLGSKGHEVERVQVFLMRKLGFIRPPNSLFDHLTQSRVESWFKAKEISQELYDRLKLNKMLHDQRKNK